MDTQNRLFALRYASGQKPESKLSSTWLLFPSHSNSPTMPIRRKKYAMCEVMHVPENKTRRCSALADITEQMPDVRFTSGRGTLLPDERPLWPDVLTSLLLVY